jgi:hypothetical protein
VFFGPWPRLHQDYQTTDWWLIHIESDAIYAPACSKQADRLASIQGEVVYVFSKSPESDRPYANVLDQHTARSYNREACYKGAATP